MSTTEIEINAEEFYGDKAIRWYQIAARNKAINAVERGVKRIAIVLPTGAGKTVTIAATLGSAQLLKALGVTGRKLKVLFIAHNSRLLTQAENTFAAENNVELILQSMMSPIPEDVLRSGFDIIVQDETHHESCMSLQLQLGQLGDSQYNLQNVPFIGLTATPDRADGVLIKFQEIINPISREQAVKEGWLADAYVNTFVDGSERSKSEVVIDILNQYAHTMEGTLVFVRTKAEAEVVNEHILSMGYASIALLNQSATEMDNLLNSFSKKEIQFIVSCNRISEGTDLSGASCILIGKTVGSLPLLNQLVGRVARPDCPCHVYEIVNPLAKYNLDVTAVTGTPKSHKLIYQLKGKFVEEYFDYTHKTTPVFNEQASR